MVGARTMVFGRLGPPTAGPDSCHGGSNCAGTVLGGNYPGETDSRLINPSTRPPGVSGDQELHPRFWPWFSYAGDDAGYVQISVYDEMAGEWPAWANIGNPVVDSSSVWSPSPLFKLGEYAEKKIRIAFFHTAARSYVSTGWYVDDIQIPGCTVSIEELFYFPVQPCRIVDTRNTSAGIIDAGTQRNFRVYGSVGGQGGNLAGCPSSLGKPHAAHLNMVVVDPTGKGNLQALPVGADAGAGLSVTYNSIDTNLANAGSVKTVTGSGPDISVASDFSSAHTVIDVLGHYSSAPSE